MRTLSGIKWRAGLIVDEAVGRARMRHITDAPGQPYIYALKLEQARAYLEPGEQRSPGAMLVAEAQATARTARQVADAVIAAHDAAAAPMAAIETIRFACKAAISAAATEDEVVAARDAAERALNAI